MKFFTLIILSFTLLACEQKTKLLDKDKERIDKVCDTFMNFFADGRTTDALLLLKKNTVMSPSSIDTLEVTITNQMNKYLPEYGKILSAEFIVERKIKDFITKRLYILRFEQYYLKFDFTLYKTNSGWTVTNFNYDEDLIELLY